MLDMPTGPYVERWEMEAASFDWLQGGWQSDKIDNWLQEEV